MVNGTSARRGRRLSVSLGATLTVLSIVALLGATAPPASGQEYARSTTGTRILEGGNGLTIKVLVEAANLGGDEVEVGEITFPVGSGATPPGATSPRGHRHGAIEIFYVLEGTLDHIVNGQSHVVEPGGVGIVRPGDEVVHRVIGDVPVRAIVIWAPGGEVARIAPGFRQRPLGGGS